MESGGRPESPPATQLTDFRVARFRLTCRARTALCLPEYKGATLRGGFGYVFRRIACLGSERGSGDCLLGEQCVYHYIFETPPPSGSVVLDKVPTAPHPFVIEPPLETKQLYEPGEQLIFHLVLIGRALDYLAYFIYAFDELGRVGFGKGRGTYTLETVEWLDATGTAVPLYENGRRVLKGSFSPLTIADLLLPAPRSFLTLRFLTPTRLKFENHLSRECEFHLLFRNLSRRLGMLGYFHCGEEFPPEQREFIERARAIEAQDSNLHWVDWERYSTRQRTTMRLGGIVGQVTFRGDYSEFLPYLLLGTYTHVGKGTTFGLGQYEIVMNQP